MVHALGLSGRRFRVVRLGEFTEEQAAEFLRRKGIGRPLPDWLPRKPLLLAYLAHQDLLEQSVAIDSSQGFGFAWDEFLRLICQREATQRSTTMDAQTIRRVLERLACDVRATVSGTGPLTGRELAEAYRLETGQFPGEGVLMQLQRLPGMTERGHGEGARSFVDEDMLSALQGSAVARILLGDLKGVLGRGWLSELGTKGIAMACYRLQRSQASVDTILGKIRQIGRGGGEVGEAQLAADGVMTAIELMREKGEANLGGIEIEGVHIGTLDCEDVRIDGLEVRQSVVREVILGPTALRATLSLRQCLVERVSGVAAQEALPKPMFIECEVETVDELATNSAVVRSALPDPMKALITILRKLYLQPGAGRKRGALKRGIPNGPILSSVDDVLRILEGEGLVTLGNEVVHPVRRQTGRAMQILNAPALSADRIVDRVRRM
jgi:hypothetical protein